ncbi:MAG TPA: hypothetical protein VL495_03060 [Edaphobacter sp.]|jgi:urocanate hydratase|nr:hypothetical protein [Edaphobacter sp.]
MALPLSSEPLQLQVLHTFTILQELRSDWGGALILSLGLESPGAALTLAANIAGAVSLSLDDDPVRVREIVRSGMVDFGVTTLDEAIRTMKNELRQHRPLSVVLNAPIRPVLAEIAERGLAPQLFSSFFPWTPDLASFALELNQLGTTLLDLDENSPTGHPLPGLLSASPLLASLLERNQWKLYTATFESASSLRDFDSRALQYLSPTENLRRRWLESAPRLLHRQRPPQRVLWLTSAEAADLLP